MCLVESADSVVPEAALHVLEPVVAGDVGEVEEGHVARTLITEGQTLKDRDHSMAEVFDYGSF